MKRLSHLLGNANIEGAVGEAVLKAVEAGPTPHRRMDAHNPLVLFRLRYQGIRKDGCVGRRLFQTPPHSELDRTAQCPHFRPMTKLRKQMPSTVYSNCAISTDEFHVVQL